MTQYKTVEQIEQIDRLLVWPDDDSQEVVDPGGQDALMNMIRGGN